MEWYTSTWMVMCLLYGLDSMVKMWVFIWALDDRDRLNQVWLVGYYKTYIISCVGHSRLNFVGLLVLWMVEYSIWDISWIFSSTKFAW